MRITTALKSIGVVLAAAIVVSVAAIAWLKLAPHRVPPGQPPLATLGSGSLPVPAYYDVPVVHAIDATRKAIADEVDRARSPG